MTYILSLIGITLLCGLWMVFQLWLKRVDPQRDNYKPGCGACQSGSCGNEKTTIETTITLESIEPAPRPGFRGNLSGENECEETKSP